MQVKSQYKSLVCLKNEADENNNEADNSALTTGNEIVRAEFS